MTYEHHNGGARSLAKLEGREAYQAAIDAIVHQPPTKPIAGKRILRVVTQ